MLVLITGASSGIGRALALHYLNRGATIAAVARRPEPLNELRGSAKGFAVFAADVGDRAAMAATVAEIERTLGPIDLAIACAGIAEAQVSPDLDLEALDRMLATNARGAFNTLVPAASAMRKRGHGQIVALSSLAALHGVPALAGYSVSKAALDTGMQAMRLLLHGSGVDVTTVAPGFIATEMTAGRIAPGWCMPLDRAVQKIVRAIERRQAVYRFPFWPLLMLRGLGLLPLPMQAVALAWAMRRLLPQGRELPARSVA
jgi:NAD(P)-dependent dehydrogenase (short-subunit alcohol dehydrogenase family)